MNIDGHGVAVVHMPEITFNMSAVHARTIDCTTC
jgi:hypothetical protein